MIRKVVWLGDTRKRLKAFPKAVQWSMGNALMAAQYGETADGVKLFRHAGSGVFEIAERYDKNAYRLVYAVRLGVSLYVLHVFQKKSKSGIATPKPDVDLIKQRLKEAQGMAFHGGEI